MTSAVPAASIPVADPMLAIAAFALDHVPPPVALVYAALLPTQIVLLPEIAAGSGLTVASRTE